MKTNNLGNLGIVLLIVFTILFSLAQIPADIFVLNSQKYNASIIKYKVLLEITGGNFSFYASIIIFIIALETTNIVQTGICFNYFNSFMFT